MAEKLIDMHMHTCYSDGELTPDQLIREAISKNVGTMAITDHDTVNGLKNIKDDYKDKIDIFNGIELSAQDVISLFNKACNYNDKNNIEKDKKGYYIENDERQQ